jgi:5-methylcytosine-specific restriction endonuclease McrA
MLRRRRRTKPRTATRIVRVGRRVTVLVRASWERHLDVLWKRVLVERDGYRCLHCGKGTGLQGAHVWSRQFRCLRWHPDNGMTLCGGCHLWWHHRPVEAMQWWLARTPEAVVLRLRAMMRERAKVDLGLQQTWLEQELARLQKRAG